MEEGTERKTRDITKLYRGHERAYATYGLCSERRGGVTRNKLNNFQMVGSKQTEKERNLSITMKKPEISNLFAVEVSP